MTDLDPIVPAGDAFPATRREALRRLEAFAPRAGRYYEQHRNDDLGPGRRANVSQLSPYLRHRLITEREVVARVLAEHTFRDVEKFVQEVLWRTYWKGWLEMRPSVWQRYVQERDEARHSFRGLRDLASAESGTTGIEGFDDWARALVETGYLHNHARMWFASIWIFTLRLPWTLGAAFFMEHLIDADPASNTLSWRWVAGLQTVGKTYLATADNIARHSKGRFVPKGLATSASPLVEPPIPAPESLPNVIDHQPNLPALLLVTAEDMHPESAYAPSGAIAGTLLVAEGRSGACARSFIDAAAKDTASRIESHYGLNVQVAEALDPTSLMAAATDAKVSRIVTSYVPVGPLADTLEQVSQVLGAHGVEVVEKQRDWDKRFWPHAKKGFFPFKQKILALLSEEGLESQQ